MPSKKNKSEGFKERNDTLVVVKADGGLVLADDVYQEFGELHSDKDSVTIDIQHKIPVLRPTILGRPPVQHGTLYYVDEEPLDAGFDSQFMHGKLKSAYSQTISGDTVEADKQRSHKRKKDLFFMITGVFFLAFALIIAPMMGLELRTGGEEGTVAPVRATDGNQQPSSQPLNQSAPSAGDTAADDTAPVIVPKSAEEFTPFGNDAAP